MRVLFSILVFCTLAVGSSLVRAAGEETQLVESINAYRSEVRRCDGHASEELTSLQPDSRLVLPATGAGDLQGSLARAGYPMVVAQSISLSGPRDPESAMQAVQESFCRVVLDPQYADIGVSREGRDWRIVLARPVLHLQRRPGGTGNWVFGKRTIEETLAVVKQMTLEGVAEKITCPLLIVHGENDRQVPLWHAEKTYERAINSPGRKLVVCRLADGGAEHCGADNGPLVVDIMSDWVAEQLGGNVAGA